MTTVLVVDDNDDMRLLVELSLRQRGFAVVTAQSGEEALRIIDTTPPDAVVLDLRMPGIGGLGVIERLRDSGQLPALPVIVLSAHVAGDTEEEVRAMGCRGFLNKPFDIEALNAEIDRVLGAAGE